MFKKKKGQVAIYIVFMFLAVIVITISAVVAPMGVLFNTRMYEAGEDIILMANESISNIDNASVKAEIQGILANGVDNAVNNIEINNALFQYGWILVLGLVVCVLFLYTRSLVEFRNPGGGLY